MREAVADATLGVMALSDSSRSDLSPSDFVLEIEIGVPRSELHAFLCDLHNYVPLHPLIESIEEISPTDELPRARRFRVVDRIPLGPLRLRTVYTAALDPVTEHEVHGHAWQSPGVRLHTVYALSDTPSGTRLVERVSVRAPRILRRFVISQARKSHQKTLAKMKLLLEGRSEERNEGRQEAKQPAASPVV